MKRHLQSLIALLGMLTLVGLAVQALSRANAAQQEKLQQYQTELRAMDDAITQLDRQIVHENDDLAKIDRFYRSWVPEIEKCSNSDALISDMLVNAYSLNLVPLKKEVKAAQPLNLRGQSGLRDRIHVSVSGRYDRLVRFLDRIRREYPFLRIDCIDFTINDANVVMSLEMSKCRLTVPEEDLEEVGTADDADAWVQSSGEDDEP